MAGTRRIASTAASSASGALATVVDANDADRAGIVAAEREARDVDAVAAENRPDLADDARLIAGSRSRAACRRPAAPRR